jgi:hypothetical protein
MQRKHLRQPQPTTLDIATVELTLPPDSPCAVSIVEFAGTNTAAERKKITIKY